MKKEIVSSISTGNLGGIWTYRKKVYFSTLDERGNHVLKKADYDLKVVDLYLSGDVGDKDALFLDDRMFNITRNQDGNNKLFEIKDNTIKNIPLSVFPEGLIKLDQQHILLIGSKADGIIQVFKYDLITGKLQKLRDFNGYSIVMDIQSNDKVITALIGNMQSFYNEYDLAFSIDKGKSWKIVNLKEKNYVSPNCLVNNIMYMVSGGGRIQKIMF